MSWPVDSTSLPQKPDDLTKGPVLTWRPFNSLEIAGLRWSELRLEELHIFSSRTKLILIFFLVSSLVAGNYCYWYLELQKRRSAGLTRRKPKHSDVPKLEFEVSQPSTGMAKTAVFKVVMASWSKINDLSPASKITQDVSGVEGSTFFCWPSRSEIVNRFGRKSDSRVHVASFRWPTWNSRLRGHSPFSELLPLQSQSTPLVLSVKQALKENDFCKWFHFWRKVNHRNLNKKNATA